MRRYLDVFRRGFLENVRFALVAIREHKLRAGLTTLGIILGVSTVMAMVVCPLSGMLSRSNWDPSALSRM